METISLCSSILSTGISESSSTQFGSLKRCSTKIRANGRSVSYNESDCRGHLVDENMIVLRKRIHETNVIEPNYEPPQEWMEWEKQQYERYDELICEVVGLLQLQLMKTRPCLALGMLMLLSLSIPGMIISHMIEAAHESIIVSGFVLIRRFFSSGI